MPTFFKTGGRAEKRTHPFHLYTHAEVLDLDVFVDAVLRAFAAEPRLLDAAERRDFVRDEPRVDADHAVFERFGDAPHAADVAAVEVRRETELGVVRETDDV